MIQRLCDLCKAPMRQDYKTCDLKIIWMIRPPTSGVGTSKDLEMDVCADCGHKIQAYIAGQKVLGESP